MIPLEQPQIANYHDSVVTDGVPLVIPTLVGLLYSKVHLNYQFRLESVQHDEDELAPAAAAAHGRGGRGGPQQEGQRQQIMHFSSPFHY